MREILASKGETVGENVGLNVNFHISFRDLLHAKDFFALKNPDGFGRV
jgi:hypothetical protein